MVVLPITMFALMFFFVSPSLGQNLSNAEVNRIVNQYVRDSSRTYTNAEIRALRERVRQTGSPYTRQQTVPQTTTPAAAVTVTASSGSMVTPSSSSGVIVSSGIHTASAPSHASDVTVTATAGLEEYAQRNHEYEPNPTNPTIAIISPQIIRGLGQDIYEAVQFQIEQIREILADLQDITPETLTAKLREKGAEPAHLSELVLALENGESSAVSRIWITAGGDPVEAGSLSRMPLCVFHS